LSTAGVSYYAWGRGPGDDDTGVGRGDGSRRGTSMIPHPVCYAGK